jgi:ribosome-associated toxin RatA of RatAB toxin-antitoxin module
VIEASVVIRAGLPQVYRAFADIRFWPAVLPDVRDVKVLYEDPCHQEFTMTVERPPGLETVRGIRFLHPERRIEMFQPQPPPGFSQMQGTWTFEPTGAATRVTAGRSFRIHATINATVAQGKLREYLRRNLDLFRATLEGQS